MDLYSLNFLVSLCYLLVDGSSIVRAYDFQCLTCDNFIDGPGCGEFTKQIPVRACRTFCYFAIVHNRSSVPKAELATMTFTRAIRDCSPYDDMSIESNLLLESKLGSLTASQLDIVALKRCNSEQCNNDFYLRTSEFLADRSSSLRQRAFPLLVSFSLTMFYSRSLF